MDLKFVFKIACCHASDHWFYTNMYDRVGCGEVDVDNYEAL